MWVQCLWASVMSLLMAVCFSLMSLVLVQLLLALSILSFLFSSPFLQPSLPYVPDTILGIVATAMKKQTKLPVILKLIFY